MKLAPLAVLLAAVAPPAAAEQLIAIRAGRVIDVEQGEVRRDLVILVRGERIERLQAAADPLPKDARVLDLSRYTVLPGLIDCHTHLVDDAQSSGVLAPLEHSEAQQAYIAALHARQTLLAGFTSVRDVGTWRVFTDVALRDAIDRGIVPGPRMAVAGTYVTRSGGAGDLTGVPRELQLPPEFRFGVANSALEVRQRVRELLNGGADFIKVMATGAVLTRGNKPGVPELTEDEMHAAVLEAALFGAKVTAHAHGAEGIKNAIRAGVQSIEHGSLMDDEAIRMMKEHGTFLIADIYNGDYIATEGKRLGWPAEYLRKNDETTDAQRAGFRRAVAAGVKLAYGTDSGVYPHGWNAKQLPYMVRYGMTPMQAIQSATIVAARNIGREDRVGSLTAGKYADLIALEGDALADLGRFENVPFVMQGGVVVKGP